MGTPQDRSGPFDPTGVPGRDPDGDYDSSDPMEGSGCRPASGNDASAAWGSKAPKGGEHRNTEGSSPPGKITRLLLH